MINRRSLITGLVSLVAAPAIVRVSSIMPVKALPPPVYPLHDVPWVDAAVREQILADIAAAMQIPVRYLTGDRSPLTEKEELTWRRSMGFAP